MPRSRRPRPDEYAAMAGAKSLGIKLAMPFGSFATPLDEDPDSPIIVAFSVHARAVPWKAPTVTKHGTFSAPEVKSWQATVGDTARKAMQARSKAVYGGPVSLHLIFVRPRVKARPTERLWVGRPDLTNLTKAVEDSLNGIVYADDGQVVESKVSKIRGDRDSVYVRVEKVQVEDCVWRANDPS